MTPRVLQALARAGVAPSADRETAAWTLALAWVDRERWVSSFARVGARELALALDADNEAAAHEAALWLTDPVVALARYLRRVLPLEGS